MVKVYVLETETDEMDASPISSGAYSTSELLLDECISRLQKVREDIPEDYRAKTIAEFETDYESSTLSLSISYERPETDDEFVARLAKEMREKKLRQDNVEARERAEFERLRLKFQA